MPSAAVENTEEKVVKPEEKLVQLRSFIEKKIRNLDKRRNKLEVYKTNLADGKTLDIDQSNAVEAYDTVVSTLDLCRDVVLQLKTIIKDRSNQKKNDVKRRNELKTQHNQDRLKMALRFQDILHQLRDEKVKEDFLNGRLGAIKLDEIKLQQLLELEALISIPTGDKRSQSHLGIKEQTNASAEQFGNLIDGTEEPFQDKTFKHMKMLLNSISTCPYPKRPKPKKEAPPPTPKEPVRNEQVENIHGMVVEHSNLHTQHQTIDFNQGDIMANGFPSNQPPPMSYSHMLPELSIPMQSQYYNQNHIPPLEICDLMLPSSSINFLQESQVNPETAAVYMDPAVVSFGSIKPETLMQMHEQQMVQPQFPPPSNSQNLPVQNDKQTLVYHLPENTEESPPVEPAQPEEVEPVKTSWADESIDRWPNEINGESNVWNGGKSESNNWSDDVDDRRSNYRGKPNNRRNNYGNYRGRGYGGNYPPNRGNSFGSSYRGRNDNGFKSRPTSRGNGMSYNRGSSYRGYRGGYQSQQQRT